MNEGTATPEQDEEQLAQIRTRIDEIDYRVMELLDERARMAQRIGELKRRLKRPIVDRTREREVVDRLVRSSANFPESALRSIYSTIHAAMIDLQLGDEKSYWNVVGSPKSGYALMSGDRILLAVGGEEPNRLITLAELHNQQVHAARVE